ncbi:YwgA family protein [Virgibacillus xinjiangensis]|uniref:YwgA family protein n=1 Tax=Virgibacillus xinjiangensis TaxID=393090 RepID=A0ABV7CTA6_9BACI
MLTNHARLMQFFTEADELTGRKKLQKMIYIMQKCNMPFEEKYEFHFYGPYSEELTLRVEELCNLGFVSEVKEDKGNYSQYRYTVTKDGRSFLQQFSSEMPNLEEYVSLMQDKSSRFLELVSTIMYFDHLPLEENIEKVHTVKPKQKYTEEEIEEALQFIDRLKQ